jgi:type IV secretion system protein VirB4
MVARALRRNLALGAVAARDLDQSLHIPYLRHVEDRVILTKQGFLVAFVALGGLCFQTLDQADLNLRYVNRNVNLRALGSSRFAVYGHVIRRAVQPTLDGEFDNPFVAELDARYRASLEAKRLFVNEIVLSIIRRPMQGRIGLVESAFDLFRREAAGEEPRAQALRELIEVVTALKRDLSAYNARILSVARREGGVFSEPIEFLAKLLNGAEARAMPLPRMGLDRYLAQKRLFVGSNAVELRGAVPGASTFGAMLSIKEYPPFSGPGLLDGLLTQPHEFILTQSFALHDRAAALEKMNRTGRQVSGSDDAGTSVADDVDAARDKLASGEAVFGDHHLSLLALAPSPDALTRAVSDLGAELSRMNVVWVREDLNLEPAFWAQLPGNFAYIARRAMISSLNYAGFFSGHNFPVGATERLHWGTPIALLETTSQTAYAFNFHVHDLGNFTVVGPSGSGKTVALAFLLGQAMRVRPTPRCVFFDKDRGAEIFIRALGGRYEVLTPGEPSGLNPFQIEPTSENRAFLVTLLSYMLRPADGILPAGEARVIADAVERMMALPRPERSLTLLPELLRGRLAANAGDLAGRLAPWLKANARGWLFANPLDRLSFDGSAGVWGFDMTKVLDDPEIRTAALLYIFHRTGEILDGRPAMIFLDEGWRLLDDEVFLAFITDMLKTIRKRNGIVGFGTQSAADIVRSRAANTLIEQTATNIFFPNAKADEASYVEAFRLSGKELAFIRQTAPESRTFLIRHAQDSVVARLDLSAMPDVIKVLSGRTETVREMERLRAELGDDPGRWLPAFCGWSP